MTDLDPPARRLVAGALGPERRPYRKDPDEPRWFEPLHVRAAGASRSVLADAVAAGADVLVAPTWLTHRRALLPVGETRRAAAWTAAAVRVAREAVDRGLELRERAAEAAAEAAERGGPAGSGQARGSTMGSGSAGGRGWERGSTRGSGAAEGPAVPRDPVLVAGVLPFLGGVEEAESGKLAPRDAGVERDLRAAAGLLAEAEPDLLLVEGGPSVAGARAAADAAVETGLPVWMTVPVGGARVPALTGGETIEAWATSMTHAGVDGYLLVPAPGCDVAAALERLRAAGMPAEQTGVLPMLLGASRSGGAGATDDGEADDRRTWPWMRGSGSGAAAGRAGRGAAPDADRGSTNGDHDRSPRDGGGREPGQRDPDPATDDDGGRDATRGGGDLTRLEMVATRWLEAGAWHLGLGDGATPERLAALRAAMDAVDGARLAARAAARDRWVLLVGEAARRAPGGRAAWIGPRDAGVALPAGFAWTVVPADALGVLPAREHRLVIAAAAAPPDQLAALLERGGILLARAVEPAAIIATGLRTIDVLAEPTATLARLDP